MAPAADIIRVDTRARQRTAATVVFAALALLTNACTQVTGAISPATTTTDVAAATTLSNGEDAVDFETYEAAVNDLVGCMEAAGAPITDPVLDQSSGLFVYDYDASNELVYDGCYAETIADIDAAYRLDPTGPPEEQASGPVGNWTALPEGSWVRLLSRIPDTTNTRFSPVTIIDLERARAHFDIDLPEAGFNDRKVLDYLGALAADAGIVPAGPLATFGRSAYPDQIRTELGFDHRSFDRLVSAGTGAKEFTIAEGRFDPVVVATAVGVDPVWSPIHEIETYENVEFHRWGIDFELDLDRFTATRTVGHNRRLSISEERLIWVRWTEGIHLAIDTEQRGGHSLADQPELNSLAIAADDLDLYSALLTASIAPLVGTLDSQRIEGFILSRPDSVLIGDGADEGGRFTAIVLDYGNPIAAEDELVNFEGRIAQMAETDVSSGSSVTMEDTRDYVVTHLGSVLIGQIWLIDDAQLPAALDLISFR